MRGAGVWSVGSGSRGASTPKGRAVAQIDVGDGPGNGCARRGSRCEVRRTRHVRGGAISRPSGATCTRRVVYKGSRVGGGRVGGCQRHRANEGTVGSRPTRRTVGGGKRPGSGRRRCAIVPPVAKGDDIGAEAGARRGHSSSGPGLVGARARRVDAVDGVRARMHATSVALVLKQGCETNQRAGSAVSTVHEDARGRPAEDPFSTSVRIPMCGGMVVSFQCQLRSAVGRFRPTVGLANVKNPFDEVPLPRRSEKVSSELEKSEQEAPRKVLPESSPQLVQEPKEVRLASSPRLSELLPLEEQRSPKLLLQLKPEEKPTPP